jgi:hypothetical protein
MADSEFTVSYSILSAGKWIPVDKSVCKGFLELPPLRDAPRIAHQGKNVWQDLPRVIAVEEQEIRPTQSDQRVLEDSTDIQGR